MQSCYCMLGFFRFLVLLISPRLETRGLGGLGSRDLGSPISRGETSFAKELPLPPPDAPQQKLGKVRSCYRIELLSPARKLAELLGAGLDCNHGKVFSHVRLRCSQVDVSAWGGANIRDFFFRVVKRQPYFCGWAEGGGGFLTWLASPSVWRFS
jgi:hypothetical protein